MPRYDTDDHYEAFYRYEKCGSISQVARGEDMPSKPTLLKWKKEGKPQKLTKGRDWDVVVKERRQQAIQRSEQAQSELQKSDETDDFLATQRLRMQQMLDVMYEEFMSGNVDFDMGDFSKIMGDFLTIDNRKADQVEWMRDVMRVVLEAVRRHVEQDQFHRIQQEMISIEKSKRSELGKLPNQRKFTGESL